MACSSCGQKRAANLVSPEEVAARVNQGVPAAVYTVTHPDGTSEDFDDYQLAAIARRRTNGTLTTTTAAAR
jgi:hypothetical protein